MIQTSARDIIFDLMFFIRSISLNNEYTWGVYWTIRIYRKQGETFGGRCERGHEPPYPSKGGPLCQFRLFSHPQSKY